MSHSKSEGEAATLAPESTEGEVVRAQVKARVLGTLVCGWAAYPSQARASASCHCTFAQVRSQVEVHHLPALSGPLFSTRPAQLLKTDL